MKKAIGIIILGLLLSGNAYSKSLILSKCFNASKVNKFDEKTYDEFYYSIDLDERIVTQVLVYNDEALEGGLKIELKLTAIYNKYLEKSKKKKNLDVFAEDIRLAIKEVSKIYGNVDIENILDIIFSDFCIGK